MKALRTSNYDIQGNSFFRVLRFNLLNMLVPIGNFRTGTGLKPAMVLLALHVAGKPVFTILIRLEPYLHKLYKRLGRAK